MKIDLIHDTRHLYTRFGINVVKAMLRSISGGKQAIRFTNTTEQSRPSLVILSKLDNYFSHAKFVVRVPTSCRS